MYYLKKNVIGKVPVLEISESEYIEIAKAKKVLRCGLSIEEKFEILHSNFTEFEFEASDELALQDAFNSVDYRKIFDFRILAERRLANLLTSTKTYVDQIPSAARDTFTDQPEVLDAAKKYFHEAHDSCFEYRFMEMLRNHVQHNGIAVHSLNHSSKRTEDGIVTEISLLATKEQLVQNSKNKKVTLNEMPQKVDLLNAGKAYVQQLTNVHRRIRDLTSENILAARKVYELAISRYENLGGESLGLTAFDSDNQNDGAISMTLEFDNVRLMLLEKNVL
ncbi:hypothetical protein ERW49_09770 [Aliivibrio finisterrensis]|uniref:Uncharacterized protein n=1 Tax=Aliivibrio finisterrensis TaxID=511998 RepID=A0A4Q5KJK6_9GAMM|nr:MULTISPECIES: hypothetical protein [Aliivibrio]MDD9173879.1 hypothetical protein [Aliivibrio sp. S3TY1]MDD9190956.1 hypothetical protein [Aliivibrio sp. S2TY2]RYU46373.1 hypothetical protein ERW49_09770 [Aliivibrio finisterrensis]